jgi:hypothetical protein
MSAKYRYEAGIADALVRGDEGETADAGGGGYGAIHWVAKDTEMRGVEGDFVGRREQVKLRISPYLVENPIERSPKDQFSVADQHRNFE